MSDEQDFQHQLSFAAHELCTPLTLIKFYAEALKESDSTERDRFADNIMQLSQELCDSSRFLLQAWSADNQNCKQLEAVNLEDFLPQKIELQAPLIKPKKIKIRLEGATNIKTSACKAGLNIMLNNLLHNAIKFSPKGSTICVDVNTNPLTIKVTDQAAVITEADREKIFEPLQKQQTAEPHTGFGLGLYICQQVSNRWGTKVWLEPNNNQTGNTFCFTLPQ